MPSLTDGEIRRAFKTVEQTGKQLNLVDDEGHGTGRLVLVMKPMPTRVTADWMAQQWRDKKRTKKKLGSYPSMTLAQAREVFKRDFAGMIQKGRSIKIADTLGRNRPARDIEPDEITALSRPRLNPSPLSRLPMTDRIYNVLFLCTGNSARSILAESILTKDGAGRFRSKSWEEFAGPPTPVMDFVFTVCDNAAGEACPVWPGQPMTAHWGIEDPAAVEGPDIEKEKAFVAAFRYMRNRISVFTALPVASLDKAALGTKLREIGRSEGATSPRTDVA